jgi:MFS transporter, FHS family, glucose/mannose:H+ symporter
VAAPPQGRRALAVGLLYAAGVAQGLALVTFPAASAIFTGAPGFALSGAEYGAMFAPQVALAILASAASPWLARRLGMRGVLLAGLAGDLLSMALLAASPSLAGSPAAFALLCVATGALGFGFGLTVTALNTLVEGLFPARADGALLALNALLGLGTALAPALVALFAALGAWWGLPLLTAVLVAALLIALTALGALAEPAREAARAGGGLPPRFWFYAAATLLYGIVETLSGNWAELYLATERHLPTQSAALALAAFWLAVTAGRLIFAALARRLPPPRVYVALPVALAAVFQFVARADGAVAGIAGFAAAGLACSALLPLSISFGGAEFPRRAATMSGELIAFYQIGYGVSAFGVGPLRQFAGFSYSAAFAAGGAAALVLAGFALLIVRGRPAAVARRGAPD